MPNTFREAGLPIGKSYVLIDNMSVKTKDPPNYAPLKKKYERLGTTDLTVDLLPGENTDVVIYCTL